MNKTYIPSLILLIILFILNYIGNEWSFYVRFQWYDIMMHILGGMSIAISTYWVLRTFFGETRVVSFWNVLLITFIGGLAWEIMEVYYDITLAPFGTLPYYVDTIKDLFNDMLGAIIVLYFLNIKK